MIVNKETIQEFIHTKWGREYQVKEITNSSCIGYDSVMVEYEKSFTNGKKMIFEKFFLHKQSEFIEFIQNKRNKKIEQLGIL